MDSNAFRKKIQERANVNRKAFEGLYREEIDGLLGLSREDLKKITPEITSNEIYLQLITVVKEASAANISQAELKRNIISLGKVAIEIAKQLPKLAALFI